MLLRSVDEAGGPPCIDIDVSAAMRDPVTDNAPDSRAKTCTVRHSRLSARTSSKEAYCSPTLGNKVRCAVDHLGHAVRVAHATNPRQISSMRNCVRTWSRCSNRSC